MVEKILIKDKYSRAELEGNKSIVIHYIGFATKAEAVAN
jgi:hypothetical protein